MLQTGNLREKTEEIISRLSLRNKDFRPLVSQVLEKDKQRRDLQFHLDELLARSNSISREVGNAFKNGDKEKAEELKKQSASLKDQAKKLQDELSSAEKDIKELLVQIPNAPDPSVPKGRSSQDNLVTAQEGNLPSDLAGFKPHWELAGKYNLIDFETGSKITGAGFPVYCNKGARLQRALINFFLDEAVNAGYKEFQPPFLVNSDSGFGTGQIPDKEGQMYHIPSDDLYLIPTAEVPVTNIFRDKILNEAELPIKCTAYSACFRREAGSWGKDVRGLNRLHQFDKVEIVRIEHPDRSFESLEEMVEYVKSLLRKLELPFRVVKLCGADLGFASAMTYDMEVFSPAQNKWLEVSSISNFLTFQSNRIKLRFRDKTNKVHLAHTLNGSALALPRIVAALLENNQDTNGIRIPSSLIPYTGFDRIN